MSLLYFLETLEEHISRYTMNIFDQNINLLFHIDILIMNLVSQIEKS
jgi:hypothetical protein